MFHNSSDFRRIFLSWGICLEAIPYLSSLITIARAVRDLYKKFRKDEEAEAIEKAASAVEKTPSAKAVEAKQTFEETLKQELGEERAKSVIEYTNLVETFFPVRPRGRVLHYGLAIEQLVLEIHRALYELDTFKLLGRSHDSNRILEFPQTAYSFYGQGLASDVIPKDGVFGLNAFFFETPHGIAGGPKSRFKLAMDDYLVLRLKRYDKDDSKKDLWMLVKADHAFPFSLRFETSDQSSEKRLEYYQFEHLTGAMISDANSYLEKVSHEFDKSQKVAEKFSSALKALEDLTVASSSN